MARTTETVMSSREKTAQAVIKGLKKRNIEGFWCPTSADAARLVLGMMQDGDSVTWGGSETFKDSGVKSALAESGRFRMVDRTTAKTPEEKREMWRDRTTADWFFMSANALTLDGEMVNVDGNSDRLSLLLHGPAHVVALVGMNKIVSDVESGYKRIRTTVCPPQRRAPAPQHALRAHRRLRRLPLEGLHVLRGRRDAPFPPRRAHQGRAYRRGAGLLGKGRGCPQPCWTLRSSSISRA